MGSAGLANRVEEHGDAARNAHDSATTEEEAVDLSHTPHYNLISE